MSSNLKKFYDKTFNIYQLPIYDDKVLIIEHHDTTGWTNPVRIYETNGSQHSHPTLYKYLSTSPNVDKSTRFRTYKQTTDNLHTIASLKSAFTPTTTTPQTGFDETLDHILTYTHSPKQPNELFITNHRTDIEFIVEDITTNLIPKLKTNLSRISQTKDEAPHSIILWISSTSPTQLPIANSFVYNKQLSQPTQFYIIVTPDHEMPQAVSTILPFTLPAEPLIDRKRHMTTLEFTFETTTTPLTAQPHIEHHNCELTTDFTKSTTAITSTLTRTSYKFTPQFSRSFYLAIPLTTHSLVSLTVSNTTFLSRSTIYHLDTSTIPSLPSPINAPTSKYTSPYVLALYTYFKTHLLPQMTYIKQTPPTQTQTQTQTQTVSEHKTLLELQQALEKTGILLKHPEVKDTISSIMTERTTQTSTTETHYNKILKLFEYFTPNPQSTNDVYELLPRSVKSFIHKINLKAVIPTSIVPPPPNIIRNYSSIAPRTSFTFE